MKKSRYEITQIGGELATRRAEEALEREGDVLPINSELMESLFNREIEKNDYWPPHHPYISFGGVRWQQGIRKGDEKRYWELPTLD